MKIKSLELRGYQGFENLRIDFHNELTVIASRNEAIGKTTILDAISILIDNYIHIYNPKSPDICGVIEDENENKMKPLALYYDTRRNSSDIRSTFSYDIDSSKFIEDIMSRAKILNPYINDSLLPFINGIVLIDEIELHHHPSWQQKIIDSLQWAFPYIQFIVTTNSPQVLSTVDNNSIRIISKSNRGSQYIETPQFQTRGIDSSYILAVLMGVDPKPDIQEVRDLNEYIVLIENNEIEREKAKDLRKKLETHFGKDHYVILDCDRLIRMQKFKQRKSK